MYNSVHLLSLCAILASALYVYLGSYILRSNPRARLNQIFTLVCATFFFWTLAYVFLPSAPTTRQTWFWFKLSAIGWTLSPSLLLHFLLLMAGRERVLKPRWVLPAIYFPGVVFFLQAIFGRMGVVDFVWTEYGWSDLYGPLTPVYAAYLIYFPVFISLGLLAVWRWGRQSDLVSVKRQAQIVVLPALPVLAAVAASGIFLPWMGVREPPEVAHLIAPIWILGIWYAVSTYRLMVMTPARVASDILRTMADAVILLNREQRVVSVNEAAKRLLSVSSGELNGADFGELFEMADKTEASTVQRLLTGSSRSDIELRYQRMSGDQVPVRASASGVQDRHGQQVGVVLVLRDISEEKQAEADLKYLATHDTLTNLPNRSLLHDRLQRALNRAVREKRPFALLTFDLDAFKQINDSYGQGIGDIVLQSTARRLSRCVRGLDTVCRLGGDEFLIVVEDLLESGDSDIVARRILSCFDEPIGTGTQAISVTGCIGIATYPFDGLDPETLIKKADLALSSAKQNGEGNFQYYAPRMDALNRERTQIEQGLRLAVARQEFFLVYQPIVDFDTGRVSGIEALLRWKSPEMGLIGPNKFIPVAERTGLILPIGRWVLETACKANRNWQEAGLPEVPIGVNISAKQLRDDHFVAMIEDILQQTALRPHLLELELTESAAMVDVKRSQDIFSRLKELGVRIIIDDFGTGYSSLVRLKLLPIHAVKVDRSFIESIDRDPKDRALVMAIVAMARNLGVDVIAEGVETVAQLRVLQSFEGQPLTMFRCDKLQGYLFSKPLAEAEIPGFITRSSSIHFSAAATSTSNW